MALTKATAPAGGTKVTFKVADESPARISVVGDFNDWTPGVHVMRRRRGGTKSVAVVLPEGEYRFRYLAENDLWMSDEDADDQVGPDSVVRAS
jgi:1,4-alpha-glucan branching enzyme